MAAKVDVDTAPYRLVLKAGFAPTKDQQVRRIDGARWDKRVGCWSLPVKGENVAKLKEIYPELETTPGVDRVYDDYLKNQERNRRLINGDENAGS